MRGRANSEREVGSCYSGQHEILKKEQARVFAPTYVATVSTYTPGSVVYSRILTMLGLNVPLTKGGLFCVLASTVRCMSPPLHDVPPLPFPCSDLLEGSRLYTWISISSVPVSVLRAKHVFVFDHLLQASGTGEGTSVFRTDLGRVHLKGRRISWARVAGECCETVQYIIEC